MAVNAISVLTALDAPKSQHFSASASGDTAFIRATSLLVDGSNAEIFYQAVGATVTILGTLCPEAYAVDPKKQDYVAWVPLLVVAPGELVAGNSGWNALKITFDGPGELHLASR